MKDNKLLLIPIFIDRAGRTVFNIHVNSGKGKIIGQIRLKPESEETLLEWIAEDEGDVTK